MNTFDDPHLGDMEKAVEAHKLKIDRMIESQVQKGIALGEITDEHFEKAPNGDSWIRLKDTHGVSIIYNFTKRTVHSYGDP